MTYLTEVVNAQTEPTNAERIVECRHVIDTNKAKINKINRHITALETKIDEAYVVLRGLHLIPREHMSDQDKINHNAKAVELSNSMAAWSEDIKKSISQVGKLGHECDIAKAQIEMLHERATTISANSQQTRVNELEKAMQKILAIAIDGEVPAAVACKQIADAAAYTLAN